ncbi:transcriptional regulatory protein WalR [Clostridium homopropionicum DSM 5847]|uniref:Stage 0 sporulation protein A homolog n=1 Tax=Clostridium homopropionicum DSM 5847 TaxID=1121318 RepID=A0A0L6Z7P5_9CLOT|nr:response regulator transcription factor [Clostridium homopropionicum]KOA18990.1 transcriptional regulatory protein WalR [Clostridium homopropionicum DSM 5847]SFG42443.1 DNA-binding response regulator, OmpR family, contains REC and winged-helix (wHTH) domain [Clostridium homopropionicum]
MEAKTILVVDDEIKILEIVEAYLKKDGFQVYTATDGEAALDIFKKEKIHLVVLDLMLPKLSGEEVCRRIRTFSEVPIIMLTAKTEEEDKIQGLAIGADDYLTKPFSARELVGRINALLRRSYRGESPLADILVFNDGDLEVDIKKFQVKKQGKIVNLTPNEFKLLNILLASPGQVFTRDQLLEKAFGKDFEGFDRTVDTHIKNIRHKIEDNPKESKYILSIYGVGYKFGGER